MIEFGMSKKGRQAMKKATRRFSNIFEMRENREYVFRLLAGPHPVVRIMLPVYVYRDDKEEWTESWRTYNLDSAVRWEGTLFAKAMEVDRENQTIHGVEDPRTPLFGTMRAGYYGIPRGESDYNDQIVTPMLLPTSVHEDVVNLATQIDPSDASVLLNGPIYLYDLLVKRYKNAKSNRPDYTSPQVLKNKFGSEVPVTAVDGGLSESESVGLLKRALSEEEFEAFSEWSRPLEEEFEYADSAAVVAEFTEGELMLNMSATTGRGSYPYWSYGDKLYDRFVELGINCYHKDKEGDAPVAPPPRAKADVPESDDFDDEEPEPKTRPKKKADEPRHRAEPVHKTIHGAESAAEGKRTPNW